MSTIITVFCGNKRYQFSESTLSKFPWLYSQISASSTINLSIDPSLFDQITPFIRNPLATIHESLNPAIDYLSTGQFPENVFVTINAGGKLFSVNREFLASTSDYFHTLLLGNFKESLFTIDRTKGEIFIDAEPKAFKAILNYIFYERPMPLEYTYLLNYFNIQTFHYKTSEEIEALNKDKNMITILKDPAYLPPPESTSGSSDVTAGLVPICAAESWICKFGNKDELKPSKRLKKILNYSPSSRQPTSTVTTRGYLKPSKSENNCHIFRLRRDSDLVERIRFHFSTFDEVTSDFWPFTEIEEIIFTVNGLVIQIYSSFALFVLDKINHNECLKTIEQETRMSQKEAMIELDFTHKLAMPIIISSLVEIRIMIKFKENSTLNIPLMSLDFTFFTTKERTDLLKLGLKIPNTSYETVVTEVKDLTTEIPILTPEISRIIVGCFHENSDTKEWSFFPISRFKILFGNSVYIDLDEKTLVYKMLSNCGRDCLSKHLIYEWSVEHIDATIISSQMMDIAVEISISEETYKAQNVTKSIFLIIQYNRELAGPFLTPRFGW
jgi:hypothetical protein